MQDTTKTTNTANEPIFLVWYKLPHSIWQQFNTEGYGKEMAEAIAGQIPYQTLILPKENELYMVWQKQPLSTWEPYSQDAICTLNEAKKIAAYIPYESQILPLGENPNNIPTIKDSISTKDFTTFEDTYQYPALGGKPPLQVTASTTKQIV
jgi:hypothetical protein